MQLQCQVLVEFNRETIPVLTLRLKCITCPFKSDGQLFFIFPPVDSLSIKSLSGTLLNLCLLPFFISSLSWQHLAHRTEGRPLWKDSSDGSPNQFIRSCLSDSLLALPFKSLRGLRWLTRQPKPLWRVLGLRPGVGQPFPSGGLLKSSIMRNFILLLNVGYVLRWKPQQWSEFGRIGRWGQACSVIVIINNYCLSMIWQEVSDWSCLKWRRAPLVGASTGQDQIFQPVFFAKDGN